jgi:hypothetical protein
MQLTDVVWLGLGLLAQMFFAARSNPRSVSSGLAGRDLPPSRCRYLSVAGSSLLLNCAGGLS